LPDVLAQAENIPILSGSTGTVFCMELLEHIPDEQRVLSEISRVIRRGGNLLISLPGVDIPKHEKLPYQRDYRRFTTNQLNYLLTMYGFENINIWDMKLQNWQINIFAICQKGGE